MSIASELAVLAANKAAIKAAIVAKNPGTAPGNDMSTWGASIASIPGGGGGGGGADASKPVRFRDYDGTVLYSYTPQETANLTELPALPTRTGLICQGWNWTLQQIKAHVADYGACEVGAMYTTDDGKTRIRLTIQSPKYATIQLAFQQTTANGVAVNWGDGSADQTYSSTFQQAITHTYTLSSYPATYIVTFEVKSGSMSFPAYIMGKSGPQSVTNPISAWNSMINEVNVGNGVTSIGNSAFYYCCSLTSITIPTSVTSIGISAFFYCYSLASITIPSGVTSIGNSAVRSCCSLTSITIPPGVTSIGTYAFYYCYSLANITIPSGVTSIGEDAFYNCYSLTSITIPSDVTSIEILTFYNCYSLTSITIPSGVTSIESFAFMNCYGLLTYDFRTATSVPTLADVDAFQNTPTTKEIIVPDALYETWKATDKWSSTTNNIVNCIVKASESSLGPL